MYSDGITEKQQHCCSTCVPGKHQVQLLTDGGGRGAVTAYVGKELSRKRAFLFLGKNVSPNTALALGF